MATRILSGIQPTGRLHLGNYLGAVRRWPQTAAGASGAEALFAVVDMHAVSAQHIPAAELTESVHRTAAAVIAAFHTARRPLRGAQVDARRGDASLFVQSSVGGQHAELQWLLACRATMGELERMTQFKDKATSGARRASLGLFAYPTLMAADILLYRATHVPVGNDQQQHLELARKLGERMNAVHGAPLFPDLVPLRPSEASAARVMSLRDPRRKMSKSDVSAAGRIDIADAPDVIVRKIAKAVTDNEAGVTLDPDNRPGVFNLVSILAALRTDEEALRAEVTADASWADVTGNVRSDFSPAMRQIEGEYRNARMGDFKRDVAEAVVESLAPMREEMDRLLADRAHLDAILRAGGLRAREIGEATMDDVKRAVGFAPSVH